MGLIIDIVQVSISIMLLIYIVADWTGALIWTKRYEIRNHIKMPIGTTDKEVKQALENYNK